MCESRYENNEHKILVFFILRHFSSDESRVADEDWTHRHADVTSVTHTNSFIITAESSPDSPTASILAQMNMWLSEL